MGNLINVIPGMDLLISSLPGLDLRTHVESRESTSILEALPGKLDVKRHSPSILYIQYHHRRIIYSFYLETCTRMKKS